MSTKIEELVNTINELMEKINYESDNSTKKTMELQLKNAVKELQTINELKEKNGFLLND